MPKGATLHSLKICCRFLNVTFLGYLKSKRTRQRQVLYFRKWPRLAVKTQSLSFTLSWNCGQFLMKITTECRAEWESISNSAERQKGGRKVRLKEAHVSRQHWCCERGGGWGWNIPSYPPCPLGVGCWEVWGGLKPFAPASSGDVTHTICAGCNTNEKYPCCYWKDAARNEHPAGPTSDSIRRQQN